MEALCYIWSHWRAVKWRVVQTDRRKVWRHFASSFFCSSKSKIYKDFWCVQDKKLLSSAQLDRECSPHPAMPWLLLKHRSSRQIQFIADASGVLCYLGNFITLTSLILDQLSSPFLCPYCLALFLSRKLFVTAQAVEQYRLSKTK